jgi:hypothetical protein
MQLRMNSAWNSESLKKKVSSQFWHCCVVLFVHPPDDGHLVTETCSGSHMCTNSLVQNRSSAVANEKAERAL